MKPKGMKHGPACFAKVVVVTASLYYAPILTQIATVSHLIRDEPPASIRSPNQTKQEKK